MAKIKIKVSISNEEGNTFFETTAHYQEDNRVLTYKEKDNTLVKYYYDSGILTRENEAILMEYNFINNKLTTGKVLIKALKKVLNLNIYTTNITYNNNSIEIHYKIEEKFTYKVEVI